MICCILGVVATGAASGLGYKHYYPTYYASNGTNGSHGLARIRKALSGDKSPVETPAADSRPEFAARRRSS
jgi:hypothetical protein